MTVAASGTVKVYFNQPNTSSTQRTCGLHCLLRSLGTHHRSYLSFKQLIQQRRSAHANFLLRGQTSFSILEIQESLLLDRHDVQKESI